MSDIPRFEEPSYETELPEYLKEQYRICSCLRREDGYGTYLVTETDSGRQMIFKTASDPVSMRILANEQAILQDIHNSPRRELADTFPVICRFRTGEERAWYLRSYIPGSTLEELCESCKEKPGLPIRQVFHYMIQLTELLSFLHSMKPSIIHRDIKPQNVVVDAKGVCHFIDLGISRHFDNSKDSDTLVMGTQLTAPPEQFGFKRTDARSDVYSLGILLLYCLTGEYQATEQCLGETGALLRPIIEKATRFDPDKRYQSVQEFQKDLLEAQYSFLRQEQNRAGNGSVPFWKRRIPAWLAALPAAAVLVLSVLILYSPQNGGLRLPGSGQAGALSGDPLTADTAETDPDQIYHFTEPLIEEAVRRQLQVWDRDLTLGELAKITSIHIMGLEIYVDDSYLWLRGDTPMFYDEWTQESGKFLQSGPISSLEDIVHMPSLHTLCLYNQNIDDISLLKDTRISYLGLGYNPLTDLSPLENNPSIRTLMIPDLPITNLASVATLPNLNELNLSGCGGITSIEELAGGPIVVLDLSLIELTDYSQLRALPNLYSLFLKRMDSNILSELNGLPLTSLTFYYSHNLKLEDIQGLENLEYLGIWGDGESLFEMGENNNLPRVWHIALAGMKIDDFSNLDAIPNLTRLEIHGADVINYQGLDRLPRLNNIVCSPEQREEIDRVYPDNEFLF